ncbi:helix-turn-helix domain-containing protein [Actinoallomurus liliacearum]
MTARQFVGKEIRRARESKQLTRAELAKTFPVSESLIASWENGRLIPEAGIPTSPNEHFGASRPNPAYTRRSGQQGGRTRVARQMDGSGG